MAGSRILVVDDDSGMSGLMEDVLSEEGYAVTTAASGEAALVALAAAEYDLLLCDVQMPGMSGVDVLRWIRTRDRNEVVVMITGNATLESAISAMKLGAWEYIEKPFDNTALLVLVRNALENASLRRQNALFRRQIAAQYDFGSVIGESAAIRAALERVKSVVDVTAPVMISGETGTGKRLFAHAIHYNGPRRQRPLVTAQVDTMPPSLMESRLFGHVRGAFPGATTDERGLFVEADQSTLVIDDVAALPLHLQPKVLRAMQEGLVTPVGGAQSRQVRTRVIALTSRDLEGEVLNGTFREDLYYCLKMVSIEIPALRDRPGDVMPLALHFLRRAASEYQRPARVLSEDARRLVLGYRWPGNVRQLSNVIQQAVILAHEETLTAADLNVPQDLNGAEAAQHAVEVPDGDLTLAEAVADVTAQVEQMWIRNAISRANGDHARAALLLGVTEKFLARKLREHGLTQEAPAAVGANSPSA